MARKIKEKILELRKLGYPYSKIQKELNCSRSVISYHCGDGQKEKSKQRQRKLSKNIFTIICKKASLFKLKHKKEFKKYKLNPKNINILNRKRLKFMETSTQTESFTTQDIINKIGDNPTCYLTGKSIDLSCPKSYHFDHKVPTSKGGKNSLENLEIAISAANFSKGSMMLDEYILLCKEVLIHHGYTVKKD